jgi:hypothetical protein
MAQAPGGAPLPALKPEPQARLTGPINPTSLSEIQPTEAMWFYEQAREEHSNPKNAVRANAEYRADQRRRRVAALQWFGYSNARPIRTITPTTSTASPQWGSNTVDPFIWSGTGRSTIVHFPATPYWR